MSLLKRRFCELNPGRTKLKKRRGMATLTYRRGLLLDQLGQYVRVSEILPMPSIVDPSESGARAIIGSGICNE